VLLLRDVLARALFTKYHSDLDKLNSILDAYEPRRTGSPSRWQSLRAGAERVIGSSRRPSASCPPGAPGEERLLILPIIGLIDPQRARQVTEQLLRGIRLNRARVVVIDITGCR